MLFPYGTCETSLVAFPDNGCHAMLPSSPLRHPQLFFVIPALPPSSPRKRGSMVRAKISGFPLSRERRVGDGKDGLGVEE